MKKIFALLLAAALMLTMLAGCTSGSQQSVSEAAQSKSEISVSDSDVQVPVSDVEASDQDDTAVSAEEEADTELTSIAYPMVTDDSVSITLWVAMPSQISPYMEDVADSAAYRAATEATGIILDATTVSTEVQNEQFQLMCASGSIVDYDVVIGASVAYGGADAAVEDGILMDLTDHLAEYMPDFYRFLQEDDEIRKLLTTDSGYIADIAGRGSGGRAQGFGIRKDWLDDAGLDIPTTYDELYQVLTVFKNNYGCPEPMLMYSTGFLDNDFLCAGYGVTQNGYYIEDGTVNFCYTEDGFKQYCEMIHQWYSEGLISGDFINNVQGAGTSYDAKMLDGTLGVFMTGVDIFSSGSAASAEDENWNAVPMADVTLTGTETITMGLTPATDPLSNKWNVTTGVDQEQLPYVLGYINWFFTEDGSIAANFGIEGEGFEYVDGEPRLTELVTNNPDGLSSFITEAMYLNWNAPFCLDDRYYDSVYDTEAQAEATTIWNSNRSNSQQYHGDMTSQEGTAYSAVYNDIDTYISTMSISFMTGASDIEAEWENFVSTIESMGIESCIEIKQAAYDRYLQR